MHKNVPLVLRILSSSVTISSKAGSIIRDIVRSGNLKIVDKVCSVFVIDCFFNFLIVLGDQ